MGKSSRVKEVEKLSCGKCGKEFIESDYAALGRIKLKSKYTPTCSHRCAKRLRKKGVLAINVA